MPQARSRRASSSSDGGADGGHSGMWLPSHGGAKSHQPYESLYDGPYDQGALQPEQQHEDAARFRRQRADSQLLQTGGKASARP
jgi:hypothetical protein